MKRKAAIYLKLLMPVLLAGIGACSFPNWEEIAFRRIVDLPARGYKLSHLDSVEADEERNELTLYSGGRAVIFPSFYTQYRADFFARVQQGDGLLMFLRTSADTASFDDALTFEFSRRGSILSQQGRILHRVDSLAAEAGPEHIRIENDGNYLTIHVGCTRFYHGKVYTPATEYVGLQPLPGSTVKLTQIAFIENEPRKHQWMSPEDKTKTSSDIKF